MGLERLASVAAGRAHQLRHGPVRADPRPDARAPGPRPGRLRAGALQLPGHRRPLAGRHVPHRRRRPPVQRGARLRPAPDPAPRRPPRPAARSTRAVPGRDRERRDRDHGATPTRTSPSGATRSSAPSPARRRSSRGRSTRARSSSRRRSIPLTGDERVVGRRPRTCRRRAAAAGRRRLPAPRHVRLPDRPDRRARGRVRRRASTAPGFDDGPRRAARPKPVRQEGRAGEAGRARPRCTRPSRPRPATREFLGYETTTADGASSRSCATAWSTTS